MTTQTQPTMKDAVAGIKAAFGAPGDHGYDTKEGKALYALYRAAAALTQVDLSIYSTPEYERARCLYWINEAISNTKKYGAISATHALGAVRHWIETGAKPEGRTKDESAAA